MTVIHMPPPKKKEKDYKPSPFDISKEMHKMQERISALEDELVSLIMYVESTTSFDMTKSRNLLNGD